MDAGCFEWCISAMICFSTSLNDVQAVAIAVNCLSNSLQLRNYPCCQHLKVNYWKHQEFHESSCVCLFDCTVILRLKTGKIAPDSDQIATMIHLVNAKDELHFDRLLENEKDRKLMFLRCLIQWAKWISR